MEVVSNYDAIYDSLVEIYVMFGRYPQSCNQVWSIFSASGIEELESDCGANDILGKCWLR